MFRHDPAFVHLRGSVVRAHQNVKNGGVVINVFLRLVSLNSIARTALMMHSAVVIGLVTEGSLNNSLAYRLLTDSPSAMFVLGAMGLFLSLCWVEWATFVLGCARGIPRWVRGYPYVWLGICMAGISAAAIASNVRSPTLVAEYLVTGCIMVAAGFRFATPREVFLKALGGD